MMTIKCSGLMTVWIGTVHNQTFTHFDAMRSRQHQEKRSQDNLLLQNVNAAFLLANTQLSRVESRNVI